MTHKFSSFLPLVAILFAPVNPSVSLAAYLVPKKRFVEGVPTTQMDAEKGLELVDSDYEGEGEGEREERGGRGGGRGGRGRGGGDAEG